MDRAEMIALIRGGIAQPGGTWADLGAGTGNFSVALGQLIGAQGQIYAVDRDGSAITRLRDLAAAGTAAARLIPMQTDFTRRLALPPLDGVLLANALHFVRDQPMLLAHVVTYLRPGGCMLLVEYELRAPVRWVPFPVPLERFQALAAAVGLSPPVRVGSRRSPSSGITLYAAVALRDAAVDQST